MSDYRCICFIYGTFFCEGKKIRYICLTYYIMKKFTCIFLIHLWLFALHASAQTDTFYVNENGVLVLPEAARFVRLASPSDSGLYELRELDMSGRLRKVFHATSKQATLKQGACTEYDDAGHVSAKGAYDKGFKTGDWETYFLHAVSLKEKQCYRSQHEYYCYQYDSLTHQVEGEGLIDRFGKRSGVWKQYFPGSDTVKLVTHFNIGKREGLQTEYYKSGQVRRKEIFQNNKLQKGEMYDTIGRKIKYFPAFTYPQYRDYVTNYLQKTEPCTAEALKKNDFIVRITIGREGEVLQATVLNVPDEVCAARIRQALMRMKKWKPALWENNPVKYTYETAVRQYVPRD